MAQGPIGTARSKYFCEAATEFEQALSNHLRVRPMDDW